MNLGNNDHAETRRLIGYNLGCNLVKNAHHSNLLVFLVTKIEETVGTDSCYYVSSMTLF